MAMDDESKLDRKLDYRSLIGSLMYAACRTKPEACFAVCLLARY